MSALTSLTDEHQLILELLGALQTYATRLRSGATLDPADLMRFSEVFRQLVDYRHQEKEEGLLMPFLARNGFEWSDGLLDELRREHAHLRYLIDVLCQAAAKESLGSREVRRQIAEAALAFVECKRRHIQKEEQLLLPAIAARLSPSALAKLFAELEQFDAATGRNLSAANLSASSLPGAHRSDAGNAPIYQQAAELVQRYSEASATVDVTAVTWAAADGVSSHESGVRVRPDFAAAGVTSFGRAR